MKCCICEKDACGTKTEPEINKPQTTTCLDEKGQMYYTVTVGGTTGNIITKYYCKKHLEQQTN